MVGVDGFTIGCRLGGSKVFQCNQCHLRIDRDVNGARNIIMRAVQRGYIKKVSVLG